MANNGFSVADDYGVTSLYVTCMEEKSKDFQLETLIEHWKLLARLDHKGGQIKLKLEQGCTALTQALALSQPRRRVRENILAARSTTFINEPASTMASLFEQPRNAGTLCESQLFQTFRSIC
jgi:hypothetical protein